MFQRSAEKKLQTTIQQSDSVISHIELDNSSYKRNFISIYVKPDIKPENFNTLKAQLNSISDDIDVMGSILIAVTATNARAVVDMLFQTNQISAADRSTLEHDVRLAERNLYYIDKTKNHSPSSVQGDVIGQLLEPYLEHIISLSNDHRKIFTLLTYAFSRDFNETYIEKEVYELIKSFGKNPQEINEVMESLLVIARVCQGTANLESTYIRLGANIPSIERQREEVADNCLKMLYKTFNTLTILDRFFYAAEIIMMTCRVQRNIYPAETRNFLDSILNGTAESRDIFFAFTHLGGFSNVVFKAVIKSKLADRTQTLKDAINSNVLTQIINISFPAPSHDKAAEKDVSSLKN